MEKLKMNKSKIESQFNPEMPISLRRTTCGITSLYNVISILENGDVGLSYKDFIAKYISLSQFNVPAFGAKIEYFNSNLTIPVLYDRNPGNIEILKQEADSLVSMLSNGKPMYEITRIDNPNINPQMAFTLKYGFDHRGISKFLNEMKYPLKSEFTENQNTLPRELDQNSCILMSVNQKDLGYPLSEDIIPSTQHISTHVIAITSIGNLGETQAAVYIDPAFNEENQIRVRTIDSLEQAFAGKYSIISKDN